MKRGEVWWVNFDPAMGSEIKKVRPAVIISNDSANRNLSRVVVVALTSNVERIYPGEAAVSVGDKAAKAMVTQIMTADKTRLSKQIGELSKSDMLAVEQAILVHLGLPL